MIGIIMKHDNSMHTFHTVILNLSKKSLRNISINLGVKYLIKSEFDKKNGNFSRK